MIYLIDFENVSNGGFNGIETVDGKDTIILFYSEQRSTMSVTVHRRLEETRAKKEYIAVKTGGKNALDFQLVTWLGWLIAQNSEQDYCIVSNDTGFDAAIDFWQKRQIHVSRSVDLNGVQIKAVRNRIQELLPQYKEDSGKILDTINKYKTKQGINNALVKMYGSEKAGVIYKAIKPMLTTKKGN